jgi:hypothetical protein
MKILLTGLILFFLVGSNPQQPRSSLNLYSLTPMGNGSVLLDFQTGQMSLVYGFIVDNNRTPWQRQNQGQEALRHGFSLLNDLDD